MTLNRIKEEFLKANLPAGANPDDYCVYLFDLGSPTFDDPTINFAIVLGPKNIENPTLEKLMSMGLPGRNIQCNIGVRKAL